MLGCTASKPDVGSGPGDVATSQAEAAAAAGALSGDDAAS